MIQRVQSIYLFLAVVALVVMYFVPLLGFSIGETQHATMYACSKHLYAHEDASDVHWGVCFIGLAAMIVGAVSIFLYKNRLRQIAVVNYFLLLVLLLFATIFAYAWAFAEVAKSALDFAPGIVLPIAAYVFGWLARRSIRKDEELVRAADRFR